MCVCVCVCVCVRARACVRERDGECLREREGDMGRERGGKRGKGRKRETLREGGKREGVRGGRGGGGGEKEIERQSSHNRMTLVLIHIPLLFVRAVLLAQFHGVLQKRTGLLRGDHQRAAWGLGQGRVMVAHLQRGAWHTRSLRRFRTHSRHWFTTSFLLQKTAAAVG